MDLHISNMLAAITVFLHQIKWSVSWKSYGISGKCIISAAVVNNRVTVVNTIGKNATSTIIIVYVLVIPLYVTLRKSMWTLFILSANAI